MLKAEQDGDALASGLERKSKGRIQQREILCRAARWTGGGEVDNLTRHSGTEYKFYRFRDEST